MSEKTYTARQLKSAKEFGARFAMQLSDKQFDTYTKALAELLAAERAEAAAPLPPEIAQRRFDVAMRSYGLPEHMAGGLWAWITTGQRPGDFLYGIICNCFTDVVLRADGVNKHCLAEWAQFMHSEHVPGMCWGSAVKAEAWAAHRGQRNDSRVVV